MVEGVHQEIPDTPPANQQVYLAPAPPPLAEPAATAVPAPADGSAPAPPPARTAPGTEADKARALYQKTADSEDIVLGGGATGQNIKRPPDFTKIPVDPRTVPQGRGAVPQPAVVPLPKKGTEAPPAPATKSTVPPPIPDAVRRANQAGGPGGNLPL
ncbi:MAG: hypothetical protein WDO73_28200 [Ignavibacteriota bacterium]